MSGFLVLIAFAVGVVLAVGVWTYVRNSARRAGEVKPDEPPSRAERKRDDPET
jgi:hypothetical protein